MITAHDLDKLLPEFINHLTSSNYSSSTIKNYQADLRRIIQKLPAFTYLESNDYGQALEDLSKEFSASSIRRFGFSLKAFLIWLETKGYKTGLETKSQTISKPVSLSALDSYLNKLKTEGTQKATVRHYLNDLFAFFKWFQPPLEKLADLDRATINRVAATDINRYISFLKAQKVADASISRYLYSLKDFFSFHKQKIVYDYNPVRNAKQTSREGLWQKFKKRPRWWHAYRGHPASDYINWAALAALTLFVGLNVYSQTLAPKTLSLQDFKGAVLTAQNPPRVLSFAGKLTDSSGNPITTETSVTFHLWDTSKEGKSLWESKAWSVKPDQNGNFTVSLGDTTAGDKTIPNDLLADNPNLYLGITTGTDTEMKPRQRIATSYYALNAASLNGLNPDQFLRSDVSTTYQSGTFTATDNTVINLNSSTITLGNSSGDQLTVNATTNFINGLNVTNGPVNLPPGSINNNELDNSSLTVNAGAGLLNGGTVSLGGSTTLDIGAGDGVSVSANSVSLNLLTSAIDGATTSSTSGLEFASGGVSLLRGCADGEVLKWNDITFSWGCSPDVGGGW